MNKIELTKSLNRAEVETHKAFNKVFFDVYQEHFMNSTPADEPSKQQLKEALKKITEATQILVSVKKTYGA